MKNDTFDIEFSKLHLDPDDIIIIKTQKPLTAQEVVHMRTALDSLPFKHRVLVFNTDVEIKCLSKKHQLQLLRILHDRLVGDETDNG